MPKRSTATIPPTVENTAPPRRGWWRRTRAAFARADVRRVQQEPEQDGPDRRPPGMEQARVRDHDRQERLNGSLYVLLRQALYTVESGGTPRVDEIQELLGQGASPDADTPDGEPLLVLLARQNLVLLSPPVAQTLPGLLTLMRTLLDARANPSRPDRYGRTPLHLLGDPETIRLLILAGANQDAQTLANQDVVRCWAAEHGQSHADVLERTMRVAQEQRVLRRAVGEETPEPRPTRTVRRPRL